MQSGLNAAIGETAVLVLINPSYEAPVFYDDMKVTVVQTGEVISGRHGNDMYEERTHFDSRYIGKLVLVEPSSYKPKYFEPFETVLQSVGEGNRITEHLGKVYSGMFYNDPNTETAKKLQREEDARIEEQRLQDTKRAAQEEADRLAKLEAQAKVKADAQAAAEAETVRLEAERIEQEAEEARIAKAEADKKAAAAAEEKAAADAELKSATTPEQVAVAEQKVAVAESKVVAAGVAQTTAQQKVETVVAKSEAVKEKSDALASKKDDVKVMGIPKNYLIYGGVGTVVVGLASWFFIFNKKNKSA